MKFVVSTTSELPSQCPRASPRYSRIAGSDVRAVVERDDPRFVDHLVANGDIFRCLHDLIGVAVDCRHHRSGQSARDAAVVHAAVEPRIRSSLAVARVVQCRNRGFTLLCLRRHAGQLSVGWIDDEPRTAAVALQVFVPVCGAGAGLGAADATSNLCRQRLPLPGERLEFRGAEVPDASPVEPVRSLERRVGFVFVRVEAFDVGVPPRLLRRRPRRSCLAGVLRVERCAQQKTDRCQHRRIYETEHGVR